MNCSQRSVALFANALGYFGTFVYVPLFVAHIGEKHSATMAGFVILAGMLGRLVSSRAAEVLYAKFSHKKLVFWGLVLESISLICMGTFSSVGLIALFAFKEGVGSGIEYPGLKNFATDVSEPELGKALSNFQVSGQLGMILGSLVGVASFGAPVGLVMSVSGVLCLSSAFCVVLWIKPSLQKSQDVSESPKEANSSTLPHRGLLMMCIASSFYWFFHNQFVVGVPLHLQQIESALAPSVPLLISAVLMSVLRDRPLRFMLSKLPPIGIVLLSLAIAVSSALVFGLTTSNGFIVAASILFVGSQLLFESSFDMLAIRGSNATSRAFVHARLLFFRTIGASVGTLASGILVDLSRTIGIPGSNWLVIALAPMAGFAIFAVYGLNERRDALKLGEQV